ncbi:kinase-like domain-containing protein, partial [Paraphysoderma sedebokerense]
DFDVIAHLAKGGFGKVSLVRAKFDGKLYALKSLKKTEVLKQENVYFMEERNIMAICNSEWITSLYASFQDEENLYLVMEYIPGGDLITLLESKDDNVLTEDEAKFYVAETICAVEELHKLNIVHRDLKPHNILIDKTGHIKLADFGACIQLDENNQVSLYPTTSLTLRIVVESVTSNITVGTPDYVSPEVLRAQEGNSSYGKECDWWSLGVVLYEIMFGDPPFYAETITATYAMIMNHKKSLKFPEDIEISEDCKDLIKQLLSDRSGRLGKNGPEEIKKHPWFKGIEWNKLKTRTPPFIPRLTGEEDTRYFPEVDEDEEEEVPPVPTRGRNFAGLHLPFIGYSFSR